MYWSFDTSLLNGRLLANGEIFRTMLFLLLNMSLHSVKMNFAMIFKALVPNISVVLTFVRKSRILYGH